MSVNLCTNPAADIDTSYWAGPLGIGTATNSQTAAVVRVAGLTGFPKTTGLRYTTSFGFSRSAPGAATAGLQYTVSWWGSSSANGALSTGYLVWYSNSGSDISYVTLGSFPSAGVGVPMRQSGTAIAPAGTVAVGMIQDGALDCVVSSVLIEPGFTTSTYADGDSPGWAWDGAPGLSPSHSVSTVIPFNLGFFAAAN